MNDSVEFKPSQLSLTLVRIHEPNMALVRATLEQKMAKAGKFLQGAPVVVEPNCALGSVQLAQVIELLRQAEMTPVGIRTTDESLIEYAELSGLAVFKPSAVSATAAQPAKDPATDVMVGSAQTATAHQLLDNGLHAAKVVMSGLRSGQSEQYLTGDVIIRGSVNSGAEVYAGGHLTILGAVRGRVHAGATGDTRVRIIARDFNPELVSIAGIFPLSEDIPSPVKRGWVEVFLDKQTLKFNSLD